MGFFGLFKKTENKKAAVTSKVLLSMPMFNDGDSYDLHAVVEHLRNFWKLDVAGSEDGNNNTAVFNVDGEMIAIAFMPVQIPFGDIKGTAQYAYNWPTAEKDLEHHTGHAIVSVMAGSKQTADRYRILSKVLSSILMTSNSVGIYQGNESLLIPKEQYLESLDELRNGGVPVSLWIYIGLRNSGKGNSAYTYGLVNFNKQEMEVINSPLSLDELYSFIANFSSYVIGSDVTLKSGETIGYTAEQKIKIISSKGEFVEGNSLKMQM